MSNLSKEQFEAFVMPTYGGYRGYATDVAWWAWQAAYAAGREAGAAVEREECAKVCEDLEAFDYDDPGSSAAAAIRARGKP